MSEAGGCGIYNVVVIGGGTMGVGVAHALPPKLLRDTKVAAGELGANRVSASSTTVERCWTRLSPWPESVTGSPGSRGRREQEPREPDLSRTAVGTSPASPNVTWDAVAWTEVGFARWWGRPPDKVKAD